MEEKGIEIKKNHLNIKDEILVKAIEMFQKNGYDKVSINEICKALGVTKGAFYHYYKSKSDLLLKEYKRVEGQLLNYYNDRISHSAKEQLRAIIDWYIDYFQPHRIGEVRLFLKVQLEDHYKNYPYTNKDQRMILINILSKGIQQGYFRKDMDPVKTTEYFFTYLFGLHYEWALREHEIDFEKRMNDFFDQYFVPQITA